MSSSPLILLENVEVTLESLAGRLTVLKGVSLTVEAGETVSVVGPSGSGKTTLLMIMAGLERATAGRVVVDDRDFAGLDEDGLALFRRGAVGVVFQGFHLVPTMTAIENAALPLEFAGLPGARDRARQALDSVGLGARLDHYPAQLSGGEQQRVALARAFVAGPKLILADEPTGNLDAKTGQMVMDLLFSLSDQTGATLVLVTHDPALAERCSRRISVLDGVVTAEVAQPMSRAGR